MSCSWGHKMMSVQSYAKKKARTRRKFGEMVVLGCVAVVACLGVLELSSISVFEHSGNLFTPLSSEARARRQLLANDDTSTTATTTTFAEEDDDSSMSPKDAFGLPESCGKGDAACGAVVLHLLGVCYMFVALAIVCDDYFVPALDVMVIKWKLSYDVAGATLMAAGGSAPELFTSLISVFFAGEGDQTGFGTIIGSAVFNVLFVIGICTLFTKKEFRPLKLNKWPLMRDSTFYMLALVMLSIFFNVITPGEIYWYEALALLLLYVAYVVLMKFNKKLEKCLTCSSNTVTPTAMVIEAGATPQQKKLSSATSLSQRPEGTKNPTSFRAGVTHLLIRGPLTVKDQAAIHVVGEIVGDVQQTFDSIDTDHDHMISTEEFKNMLADLANDNADPISKEGIEDLMKEIDPDHDGQISLDEFKKFYVSSQHRFQRVFDEYLEEHGIEGDVTETELYDLLKAMKEDKLIASQYYKQMSESIHRDLVVSDTPLTAKRLRDWVLNDQIMRKAFADMQQNIQDDAEAQSEGLDILEQWGKLKTGKEKLTYLLLAPLTFPLAYTIPNTKREKNKKWFIPAFLLSILWIMIFSYLMVWWAGVFGATVGIPPKVMGLTIIAMGTSVPDLLTSYVVASQGHGDMAVSSSLGSNIFDVLFGLPFPWFIRTMVKTEGEWPSVYTVDTTDFWIEVGILMGMVACVILIIILCGWKLSNGVAVSMFALYLVFLVQAFVRLAL